MQAKTHVSSAVSLAGWLCSLLTAQAPRRPSDCGVEGERDLLLDLRYSEYREFRVSTSPSIESSE